MSLSWVFIFLQRNSKQYSLLLLSLMLLLLFILPGDDNLHFVCEYARQNNIRRIILLSSPPTNWYLKLSENYHVYSVIKVKKRSYLVNMGFKKESQLTAYGSEMISHACIYMWVFFLFFSCKDFCAPFQRMARSIWKDKKEHFIKFQIWAL